MNSPAQEDDKLGEVFPDKSNTMHEVTVDEEDRPDVEDEEHSDSENMGANDLPDVEHEEHSHSENMGADVMAGGIDEALHDRINRNIRDHDGRLERDASDMIVENVITYFDRMVPGLPIIQRAGNPRSPSIEHAGNLEATHMLALLHDNVTRTLQRSPTSATASSPQFPRWLPCLAWASSPEFPRCCAV
ncbi:hypothetical protein SLE2022_093320 [Rubroshorea leprosula]